jgi:hypothetical protein
MSSYRLTDQFCALEVGQLDIENVGTTPAEIMESHCTVFTTRDGGLPMEPPYAREPANNFARSAVFEPGAPEPFNFRSANTMGDDAEQYRSLTAGFHIYVMGWVRYKDRRQVAVARRTAFCRLWSIASGELHPRFHIVKDPDYEHED